jgi:hypothetical protein
MPDYGEIKGTVVILGQPVERELVAVSYEKIDTGEVDANLDPIFARTVVGETRSAVDGSYTMDMAGFFDEAIIIALPDYGIVWKPNTSYDLGDRIRPTLGNETGYVYECTIAGNSDSVEPVWWVDNGGASTGAVGAATFLAVASWWPVAHAPITPVYITVSTTLYPLEIEPNFDKVVSLNHFDGDNLSTTFSDVIPGRVITTSGAPVVSTGFADNIIPGSSSLRMGAGDYWGLGYSEDLSLLTGPFTIEFIFSVDSLVGGANAARLFNIGGDASGDAAVWGPAVTGQSVAILVLNGNLAAELSNGTSGRYQMNGAGPVTAGSAHHCALTFDGTTTRLYLDGVKINELTTPALFAPSGHAPRAVFKELIGVTPSGDIYAKVPTYIEELRITKGIAFYAADSFDIPTEAFADSRFAVGREPTILDAEFSSVVSLLHFEDGSNDIIADRTWTLGGSAAVVDSQSAIGTYGLNMPAAGSPTCVCNDMPGMGASDFTVEAFIRRDSADGVGRMIFETRPLSNVSSATNFAIYTVGDTISVYIGGANLVSAAPAPGYQDGTFNHFAWVRHNDVAKLYFNGAEIASFASTHNLIISDGGFRIGCDVFDGNAIGGQVDEFRLCVGLARYTSGFTVPAEAFPDFEYDPLEDLNP